MQRLSKIAIAAMLFAMAVSPALAADVLKGGVQKDEQLYRMNRPAQGSVTDSGMPARAPMRIQRAQTGSAPLSGLIDRSAFTPQQGQANDSDLRSGVVKSGDFAAPPPKNFDLGAERGSREMVLAWERWHRQLSQIIYQRWSDRAEMPGKATVRVTVTNNRMIRANILSSNGGPIFDAQLMAAIEGLNGNPGLSFPSKSLRQKVSFEADYIASSNVTPGFNWIKNDYERVQEHY